MSILDQSPRRLSRAVPASAIAGVTLTMARTVSRDRAPALAGPAAPLALTAVLIPFRASFPNTGAALALVLVVVAVAAAGRRLAGTLATVSAAAWFDFFLTVPYERFTITRHADAETTVLILAVGIGVTEIAVRGRRQNAAAARRAGYLDGINAAARAAATGAEPQLLIEVVGASILMEQAGTALGRRYGVADIVTGGIVLAVVTSLPNAVAAVYLGMRGRGAAVLSTALNSNAINVLAGLLVPASVTGLGLRSGQATLTAAWYAGLTVLALAFAYRGRGLGRLPGAVIIGGYLAFVLALAASVLQAGVRPAAALVPAACAAAAGIVVLAPPSQWRQSARAVVAGLNGGRRRESLVPGWTAQRVWTLSFLLCAVVAACDAASGPHLILIGLLIAGPSCALFTGQWALTAVTSCFALALGVVLGFPDQVFATVTQYASLAAVAAAGLTATLSAAVLQRHHL
jgi:hypothetical protein